MTLLGSRTYLAPIRISMYPSEHHNSQCDDPVQDWAFMYCPKYQVVKGHSSKSCDFIGPDHR